MVTTIVFIALIGILQFNPAISAAINYEPIKITVNENFNAQPGHISPELQEPAVVHQGANFYFKPQLNLSPSFIPSHIEALMSLVQQHHPTCAKDNSKVFVEKDKLIDILKPFMHPLSDNSKETLSEIALEEENNLEIVKPIIITEYPKPVTPEILVISKAPMLKPSSFTGTIPTVVEEEVKKEESIILEKPTGVFPTIPEIALRPITEPIINYVEPKSMTSGLVVIPEAPALPPLSFNGIPLNIEDEVNKEESIVLEETTGVIPAIPEIDVKPIAEPIINYVEPKSMTSGFVVIPEAPELPPLSFNGIPPIVEEEVKKGESIILDESTGVFTKIPEIAVRPTPEQIINYEEPEPMISGLLVIPEAPVLPLLSLNDIHVKIEEPIVVDVEPKPAIQKFVAIPEAPILPSLSLHDISSIIEEEVKKEESIILEKSKGMFPAVPEIDVRPIAEPINNYVDPKSMTSRLVVIPEAPLLPPLSLNDIHDIEKEAKIEEPIVVDFEPKPAIQKFVAIPEAPVLPSLSPYDISSIIEEEVKREEFMTLEEPKRVFPIIPKIDVRPIAEPVLNYVEPKSMTSGLVVIPEAPALPPLSFNGIPPNIEDEVNKEESIILEDTTGVFPTIPEIDVTPIAEPILNYVEPKSMTSGFAAIPEAPELPPLSLNGIPPNFKEEVNKGESVILDESIGVFTNIPEIAVRPTTEPIINYEEPKPMTSGLVVIPEAPVLPLLSLNDVHVKIEEPIVVEVEPKPAIQKLVAIPEAPVLPSLSLHDISSIIGEEVKKEESIILEKSKGMFPAVPEIDVRPIAEPINNYVEPKSIIPRLVEIPEAPLLPPLSLNDIHDIEEEAKIEEPIVVNFEPKPAIQKFEAIPEAPVLPSLSPYDISSIIEEEVKREESMILEEPKRMFPAISKTDVRPIAEPVINYVEPKSITSGFVVMPEAPELSPLSFNGIPPIVEGEVKKAESKLLEKPSGVFPAIPEIDMGPIAEPINNYVELKSMTSGLVVIPEAPELPPLSLNGIPPNFKEEVNKGESVILDESIGVFTNIPEIAVRPTTEPIINYEEPKPMTSGLVVIPEAPVLPLLSLNDIHVKIEEPIVVEVEPKPAIQKLVAIPEAPVLPSLSLHDISSIIGEEVKKEESIILEKSKGMIPAVPEIDVRPIAEPINNYVEPKSIIPRLVEIPEAPLLPPLSLNDIHDIEEDAKIEEPIVVDFEPKPAIQKFEAIPEAPVLPSLSPYDISSIIEEEVKREESMILEEPKRTFPAISKIDMRPIAEPVINYVEPKSITSGFVVMPEAPELSPLSFNGIPPIVEGEVKKAESKLLEKPSGVFPAIPEIDMRPIAEPINNYVELKSMTSGLVVIPKAPELPPLSLNGIPPIFKEEVNKGESVILDESIDQPPKPAIQELVAIPEAPVLSSLSLHDLSSIIEEEVKKEESIILEKQTGVLPAIPEIDMRPIAEPFINYVEPKSMTPGFVVIPKAQVLPPLSFNGIPPIVEGEVKKEESILLEESTGVLPETTIIEVEPKPVILELAKLPEPPVLPSLSSHDISSNIEEEVKKEESIILEEQTGKFPAIPEIDVEQIAAPINNYVEPKPITPGLFVIPEGPVLPSLSYNGTPPVVEEVKIEESIKVEENTDVFPLTSEISAKPFPGPSVVSETAESFALENNIFPIATEEVKIEVPILFEQSIEVFPPIALFSSGETSQESEITDSYVMEEVSQPNPNCVETVKETLPPTIISKPSNNLGVFSYVPFVSYLSNSAPKTKKLMFPKPASLERFLLKKHAFRLPVTPFPKLDLNAIKSSIWGNKKQFLYPTSYAHDVVEKRIAPNMAFKKQNAPKRVKIYIRSNVPKGPSYL